MGRAGAFLTVFLLAACGSGEDDLPAQMRTAVEDYLAGRVGLAADNMKVSVDAVQTDGNRAQVEVTITASNDAAAAMQMVYDLEKRSGRWRVKPSPPAAEMEPPEAGGLPPGHPPIDEPDPALPPGHPPLEGGGQAPSPRSNLSMQLR